MPRALPHPAIAATTIPQIAPPAITPHANNTPGPDSISASGRLWERTRRSTSQRTTPPANMPAEVVIGRYTPTATGRDETPINSIAIVKNTPIRTRPQGSLWVRIPSVISAIRVALGESSRLSSWPRYSWMRPPIPGSTTYRISCDEGSTRYLPGGTPCVSTYTRITWYELLSIESVPPTPKRDIVSVCTTTFPSGLEPLAGATNPARVSGTW